MSGTSHGLGFLKLRHINKPAGLYKADELSTAVLRKHADSLIAGRKLPAMTVFDDGCLRWMASNVECYHATRRHWDKAMDMEILCDVKKGTQQDAIMFYRAFKI